MRNLEVDYEQAATLNRSYGKTSSILNELYNQNRKAEKAYD